MAVSGIDSTVKIFSADSRARQDAATANGVTAADPRSFTSLGSARGRWLANDDEPPPLENEDAVGSSMTQPRSQPGLQEGSQIGGDQKAPSQQHDDLEIDPEEDMYIAPGGLASRRRIHDQYQITVANDMNRRARDSQSQLPRGLIEMLTAGLGAQLRDEENCQVM